MLRQGFETVEVNALKWQVADGCTSFEATYLVMMYVMDPWKI